MNLNNTLKELSRVASLQPLVQSVGNGDIYAYMTNPSIKYGVFFITQNQHTDYFDHTVFNFNLFYIDRITQDLQSNVLQIQSTGMEVIRNIVEDFSDNYKADYSQIVFTPFTERFEDECAGVYGTLSLTVFKNNVCAENYE